MPAFGASLLRAEASGRWCDVVEVVVEHGATSHGIGEDGWVALQEISR
jgi:hypothetical protein